MIKTKIVFSDLALDDDYKELNSKDYTIDSSGVYFWVENGIVEFISIVLNYLEDNETSMWSI
jgi:hypothetical protein